MCGRYALYAETEELLAAYAVQRDAGTPRLEPRYNIAPTQDVPIVVAERGARRLRLARSAEQRPLGVAGAIQPDALDALKAQRRGA